MPPCSRGEWGTDNGGIHDRSRRDPDPACVQVAVDGLEERCAQPMSFQHVLKPTDRGLVWDRFQPQFNAHKGPHGCRVVQGILHDRIGEIEPLLEER